MKFLFTVVLAVFFSSHVISQDKNIVADAYFKRAKSSLVKQDGSNTERYILKAQEFYGGIPTSEFAIFGAKYFFQKRKYNQAEAFFKAYFSLNTNKKSDEYQEILLLYTYNLDALDNPDKQVVKKKEQELKQRTDSLALYYKQAKTLFVNQDFKASDNAITKFLKFEPYTTSAEYKELISLKGKIKDSLEVKRVKDIITTLKLKKEAINNVIIKTDGQETQKTEEDEIKSVEEVSFLIIEDVPVFPGCYGSKNELKDCFSKSVQRHFSSQFNADLPNTLVLSAGRHGVFIGFTINRSGKVVNINSRAPHPKIKEEVIRVMKLLPTMTPGKQRGKPINVKYSIPFTLIVDGDDDKTKN